MQITLTSAVIEKPSFLLAFSSVILHKWKQLHDVAMSNMMLLLLLQYNDDKVKCYDISFTILL